MQGGHSPVIRWGSDKLVQEWTQSIARKGVIERGSEKGQEGKRIFFPESLVNKSRDVSWDSETRQSSQDTFEIYNLLCKSQFY